MATGTPVGTSGYDMEATVQRLTSTSNSAEAVALRTRTAGEMRDAIEVFREGEIARFLTIALPVILQILHSGHPSFQKDDQEHIFRHALVDTLHRLPLNEQLKTHAPSIMELMLHLLRTDNEENGVTCIKIIIDLTRSYKTTPEDHVTQFINVVQDLYRNTSALVTKYFDPDAKIVDQQTLADSMHSFKVLTECPIATVLLFQSHRNVVNPTVRTMLPLVIDFLVLQAKPQQNAHNDAEARGEMWMGVAPDMPNSSHFAEFVTSQVKTMSFLAYVLRGANDSLVAYREQIPRAIVRMLQDCPPEAAATRKELLIATRHVLSTEFRSAFVPQIDVLLNEKVLIGTCITSQEALRPLAYSMLADLVHHVRGDLTPQQLRRVIHTYSCNLHNPSLNGAIQTMCAKLLMNLVETVVEKDKEGFVDVLHGLLHTCIDKLGALHMMDKEVLSPTLRARSEKQDEPDVVLIEKAKPISSAAYVNETIEDLSKESRYLFRTLLHGVRSLLTFLNKFGHPMLDGELLGRMFEGTIECMSLYDLPAQFRDEREAMEWFSQIFFDMHSHVFQSLWATKIEFFFESALKRPTLFHLPQVLLANQATCPSLTAIVLRFLVARFDTLGHEDSRTVAVQTIRFFKMAFQAVTMHPDHSEAILVPYLGRLVMDSFPLAAKAPEPTNYFLLLRGLFRSIGGAGGRFELLYKEVLPLLPEMLESLNRLLMAAGPSTRDLLVELCLTVPVRLTHLLPFLHYLMQPLVFALKGNPELISQGLRTLELCIDNLTQEFLDPTLSPVLRDLMSALHSHLKPQPASHQHAHTTVRILGKLGGRNRRLLDQYPQLDFQEYSDPAILPVKFIAGREEYINLGPISELAARSLRHENKEYRHEAYNVLKHCMTVLLRDGLHSPERVEVFTRTVQALFDAVHVLEFRVSGEEYIRDLSRHILSMEITGSVTSPADAGNRRMLHRLVTLYLDTIPLSMAKSEAEEAETAQNVVMAIIKDLLETAKSNVPFSLSRRDPAPVLDQLAHRFVVTCFEETWLKKLAGCEGIIIMTSKVDLGRAWIRKREPDFIRALFFVLKDMPSDPPANISDVLDAITRIIRTCRGRGEAMEEDGVDLREEISYLVKVLIVELSSTNVTVRKAAQSTLELLGELSGENISSLMLPHRDRLLSPIFTKPLRALPLSTQIGNIDAIRYCLDLKPYLLDVNEELLRLLHEALALADAEDAALIGRSTQRRNSLEVIRLRVVCIKLLTASMPLTDFFSKQHQTRQRVTGVYFKSLYSPSAEVKNVAHEGLRLVLTHQTRLPKDLLQTGLRPILMNLADPKRLSVPGLEGLARLLELLTNYFKVEIGSKLLDHFRVIADPNMLRTRTVLENEEITKLVGLVHIFHLLPPTANIFLKDLVTAVVDAEACMESSAPTPLTQPLAKFLNRYPGESVELFLRRIGDARHVRTLRNVLISRHAPLLEREIAAQTSRIISICLQGRDRSLILPGMLICGDLASLSDVWLFEHGYVIDALLDLWHTELESTAKTCVDRPAIHSRQIMLMRFVFIRALEQSPRIDLLFDIVAIYTNPSDIDLSVLTNFLYRHVAMSRSDAFRRNILLRFLAWFGDPSPSWAHKTVFFRFVINPMLYVTFSRKEEAGHILDPDIINQIHARIWRPMSNSVVLPTADDALSIELLYFSSLLVHHCSSLIQDVRKDIIKCAWNYIVVDDAVVKQTAYLLASRFFEAFDSPPKFVLRTWTGLLRPPHAEGRTLIRQALDILAPVLPKRTPPTDASGYPPWAKLTRRMLVEEGHGLSQLIVIYQLVVRHPSLFYTCRELFVPHMVGSLSKLGLQPNATSETRTLSLDLLDLIMTWEQQAKQSAAAEVTSHSEDSAPAETSPPQPWALPLNHRETIVSYLVRLVVTSSEPIHKAFLITRALRQLKDLIGPKGWNEVTVKLNFFIRALEQTEITEQSLMHISNSAKVFAVVTGDKSLEWYTSNGGLLQRLVQKGMSSDETILHESLHPAFKRLLEVFPLTENDDESQSDASDFHTWVSNAITESLRTSNNLKGPLLMLQSIVEISPLRIEPFAAGLMRLLVKATKEHITQQISSTDEPIQQIISILEICRISVAYLADQRRHFLHCLVQLADKSNSESLCTLLLKITREWVLQRKDAYPTLKEKASLLSTMRGFEGRGQGLFADYLQLIYDIYKEDTLRRTDLTMRLEPAFLMGCRAKDPVIRSRCIEMLDNSIPRSLSSRLSYVLGVQNWEALAEHYWLHLALDLLLGAIDGEENLNLESTIFQSRMTKLSMSTLGHHVRDLIQPIRRLLFLDPNVVHQTWVSVFSAIWASLSRKDQIDLTNTMIILLSKDHLSRQVDLRPNVVQTLLAGVKACNPPMSLPPYLLKYLGKTFGAWHVCLELLQDSLDHLREEDSVQDTTYDSLAELYAELAEEDMFYGLWRRRCLYPETNAAVSLEQNGMWPQAQATYEAAQVKSRTGVIPFSEAEYCLWEDHWILAAEKLQQWEILEELAKGEGNQDLLLECRWRNPDWTADQEMLDADLNGIEEIATPRRRVFQAYAALNKATWPLEKSGEFTKHLEEAIQLSLRKWVALPSAMSKAHVPLLQHFQQFVELQEAAQIFGSLAQTNALNLEKKSSDLKLVLQAWRERLPNLADDISIWSDLIAWRQHVFYAINRHYLPLIQPPPNGTNSMPNNPNTFGFRGYHETAWLVNRFAHVARKHHLLDVCHQSLNKIYTLPNIEISEAFLKLREQARCHYQNPNELQAGLDVINNTNLMYFSNGQKAEFYTLKGMFFAKLGHSNDANHAFGQAVGMELNMPKAWAEWGRYSDEMFKENPSDLTHAGNAVSCYLQAAGLHKNAKSRPLLIRVLWLLSLDDPSNPVISGAFDNYKGEAAFWYWITLIPQLLLSLGHREAKNARYILLSLAKLYPQALFWHLRTTKDDFAGMRSQAAAAAARAQQSRSMTPSTSRGDILGDGDIVMADAQRDSVKQETPRNTDAVAGVINGNRNESHSGQNGLRPGTPNGTPGREARQPWEYVEEIVAILKTAFPLLALTLETIQDQLKQRFKPSNDEDNYRILSNAVAAGLNNLHNGLTQPDNDSVIPEQSVEAIDTFLRSVTSVVTKSEFEEDFTKRKLTLREYTRRMMQWRDKYEKLLDSRPHFQSLDTVSKWLVEFQHGKYDEVEVPGQYLEHKDGNSTFTRITRYAPKVEFCRGTGFTFKRITLIGHDGTKHSFAVQVPTQTWVRREERIQQLFRIFNGVLSRRKESRKRNLSFHLPVAVPLNPTLRLLANDSSYVTMQQIYDEHCEKLHIAREDPQLAFADKFESIYNSSLSESQVINLRAELQEEIMAKMVPENIISNYMTKTMKTSYELWTMRKQYALQLASTTFMTYIMCLTSRLPSRFHISRSTGLIYMSELMPAFDPSSPRMHWNEATPFRLTPNMQHFLNPIGIEGVLTSGIMAIARSLTEPEFDMEQQLSLFIRDEVMTWYSYFHKSQHADTLFRQHVLTNIDIVVSRAEHLSCRAQDKDRERGGSGSSVPAVQTITNLISSATNPLNLAKQNTAYYPWF